MRPHVPTVWVAEHSYIVFVDRYTRCLEPVGCVTLKHGAAVAFTKLSPAVLIRVSSPVGLFRASPVVLATRVLARRRP